MPDPQPTDTPAPIVKPGYKTTEFWLALAATLISALFGSGVIPTSGPAYAITSIAATVLIALGYKVTRTMIKTAGAAVLVVLAIGATQPACAHGVDAKLKASLVTLNAASDAFVVFDAAKQAAIVKAATSEQEGIAALGAYRSTRARVVEGFGAAYHALALAAVLHGDPKSISAALLAADLAIKTWHDLQGVAP